MDKKCNGCGVTYTDAEQHFYKDKRRPSGYRSQCKACWYKSCRKWTVENWAKVLELHKEYGAKYRAERKMKKWQKVEKLLR